jgi:hypothetical protein
MTVISGGKALATCERCGKVVQLNKALLGGLHFCVSDCVVAGKHLALREEVRGHLWWKRQWLVCDECKRERLK